MSASPSPSSSSQKKPISSSRVLISNISKATTENSLKEFFAFCGDIVLIHLYSVETDKQEAVIKFESESAANTACLLNNAVIDGFNVKVELFASPSSPTPSSPPPKSPNSSTTSFFSTLTSSSWAFAEAAANKVKSLDQQYGVSETIINGANTAWGESKRIAGEMDEKFHIRDNVSSVASKTKEVVSEAASTISETVGGKSGGSPKPTSSSPRSSPKK